MIGHDLVYRPGMNVPSGNRLIRYLNKAYLPDEQSFIQNHAERDFAISGLWALKESAYKVWAKKTGLRKWNPKDFGVLEFPSQDYHIPFSDKKEESGFQDYDFFSSVIQYPIGLLHGKIASFSDYLIAFVSDDEEELKAIHWGIKTDFSKDLSKAVRKFVLERIKKEGLHFEGEIHSDKNGIPMISIPNHTIDLSFTHDHQMVSYAFTLSKLFSLTSSQRSQR